MSNTIVPPFPLARGPPAFKPVVTLSRLGHPTATKGGHCVLWEYEGTNQEQP